MGKKATIFKAVSRHALSHQLVICPTNTYQVVVSQRCRLSDFLGFHTINSKKAEGAKRPRSFFAFTQRPFFAFRQKRLFISSTRVTKSYLLALGTTFWLFIMRPFFAYRQKSLFIPGCVQRAIIELVCQCVCVTFVVFTDCESCTKPISTNP